MTKAEEIRINKIRKNIGKTFLISIGIDAYEQENGELDNCCSDAKLIFDVVRKKDYFQIDDNSILITSDNSSEVTKKQALIDVICGCERYITPETNILLFYSGHGCNIQGVFNFCVTDTILDAGMNLISITYLQELLLKLNGGNHGSVTILIDACQTVVPHQKRLGEQSDKFINEYVSDVNGVGIIYSCGKGEYSLDTYNGYKNSVFTYLLEVALCGHEKALDSNLLTFHSLRDFLMVESRRISRENVHIEQHPESSFQGEDIVYAYIPEDMILRDSLDNVVFNKKKINFEEECIIARDEFLFQCNLANQELYIACYGDIQNFTQARDLCLEISDRIIDDWEEVLTELQYYCNQIEKGKTPKLNEKEKQQLIDDFWRLNGSFPTYINQFI